MSTTPEGLGVEYAITLVHGTFARNASWTRPGSDLYEALRRRLGSRCRVTAFQWSGWNSPWRRKQAADRLRAHLAAERARTPTARQYLIGHSHGGSIALQAMTSESDGNPAHVAGIATIATPFIHVRRRHQRTGGDARLVAWFCFFPLVILSCGLLLAKLSIPLPENEMLVALFLVGGVVGLTAMLFAAARAVNGVLFSLANSVESSFRCAPPPGLNLPIIRASGDEATALLAFSQFISSTIGKIVGGLAWPLRPLLWLQRVGAWLPAFVIVASFVLLLGGLHVAAIGIGDSNNPEQATLGLLMRSMLAYQLNVVVWTFSHPTPRAVLAGLLPALLFFAGLALFLGLLVIWPALVLLAIALLPFDPEAFLAALRADISVEAVPLGCSANGRFISTPRPCRPAAGWCTAGPITIRNASS